MTFGVFSLIFNFYHHFLAHNYAISKKKASRVFGIGSEQVWKGFGTGLEEVRKKFGICLDRSK